MGLLGNVSQALFMMQKRLEHDVEGTTVDEDPVFLGEHAGKQLKLELPDGKVGIYRLFLVDARMYQLSVKAAPEDISAAEVSQFLDSFKLL